MNSLRDQVFISYSHKDVKWYGRFKTYLDPFRLDDKLSVWSDQDIKAGENWHTKIKNAISVSKVALILVSQDYLPSKYISEYELPAILENQRPDGLVVYWVSLT